MDRYMKNIIISSNKYEKEHDYWLNILSGCEKNSIIPYDNISDNKDSNMKEYEYVFDKAIYGKMKALCNNSQYAMFILLTTGTVYLTHMYTDQNEVMIGFPILADSDKQSRTNALLALRYNMNDDKTFKQLLIECKENIKSAYENQIYPLYHVFQSLQLPMYKDEPSFGIVIEMEGLHYMDDTYTESSDVIFRFKMENDSLSARIIYKEELYNIETIQNIAEDLNKYMQCVMEDYNVLIGDIDILSDPTLLSWKEKMEAVRLNSIKDSDDEVEEDEDIYVAPRNAREEELVKVWEEILGIKDISVKTSFFKLGGDSIKAIRMVAMLSGYKFSVKDLYTYPTIEKLSSVLKESDEVISQEMFTGEVALSPIQKNFFENKDMNYSHYNQSLFLYSEKGFDMDIVKEVMEGIIIHHDMLRAMYRLEDNKVVQEVLSTDKENIEKVFLLDKFKDIEEKDILSSINNVQAGLDIENGPLIRGACFHKSDGDHLLLVIHHLLIDAFSWRIILEDFARGYNQLLNGEKLRLNNKTHPYNKWVDRLMQYVNEEEIKQSQDYWMKLGDKLKSEKDDHDKCMTKLKDRKDFAVVFSQEETKLIQQKAGDLFINMDYVILGCIGLALKNNIDFKNFVVDIEGHGRSEIDEDINIARTVGWFTSVYPIYLSIDENDILKYIEKVSDNIESVPNRGLDYGILRYLSKNDISEKLDFESDIRFNYLGEFDQNINHDLFAISDMDFGNTIDENMLLDYIFDITGLIIENKLRINFNYIKEIIDEEALNCITENFRKNIALFLDYNKNEDVAQNEKSKVYIDGIKPFNDVIYKDCFYSALFPVLEFYNKSIKEILCNDVFIYDGSDNNESIDATYLVKDKLIPMFNKCGLKANRIIRSNNIISNIKTALKKGRLVIIQIDCYYSSIRKDTYEKEHWPHTILIYGYDDELESAYVLEQSDKNILDFTERIMSYNDIINVYDGAKKNFIRDKQYPSYIDFSLKPSQEVSRKTDEEYAKMLMKHMLNHKDEVMEGLDRLQNFINRCKELVKDEQKFAEAVDRLYFSINNILKAQHARKFQLDTVFNGQLMDMSVLNEIIRGWRLEMNMIGKYILTKRFKPESLQKTGEKLESLYLMEKQFIEEFINKCVDGIETTVKIGGE
ncbi:condensation domain-containing protein [Vallitalea guaymasensis]|uniref:condensation domain-containing protein n=1 Tax=Vallitalea guaymasensis TaxID=1185412 RepID=UPI000DE2E31E|nr:condensation domain-containing protein [Vallitalea guaymasensis]